MVKTGGWNRIGKSWAFPYEGAAWLGERKGMGGNYWGLQPVWRKSHLKLWDQTGLEFIVINP